jgi:hypothetical protein
MGDIGDDRGVDRGHKNVNWSMSRVLMSSRLAEADGSVHATIPIFEND